MRALILAVAGLPIVLGSCESSGTSVVSVEHTPVASISISLPSGSLTVGQTARGVAVPRDAAGASLSGRAITWQTSKATVATVDNSGMIAAVGAGSAVISASSEGVTNDAPLTVVDPSPVPVASVAVALASSSLNPGQTTQATATTRDASNNVLTGRTIAWSSDNTSVATVSGSGLVTAVSNGSAVITATSENHSGTATLTVVAPSPVPVASVTVTLASSSVTVGQTTQATATTRDANNNILAGRAVTFASSNTGVATVAADGVVTAVASGSAQITATSEGHSGSAQLTVASVPPPPAPVASVSVSLTASTIDVGATTQARATTRDANNNVLTGRVIAWSSNNTSVATVSGSGLVTAVAAGSAQITATSESQSGSATLTVQTPPPPPPPPPPGSSNEPSGMTLITDRAFNKLNEDPAWEDYNNPSIVQDATAPKSPSNVWRATYPTGFVAGSSPAAAWGPSFSYRTVYLSWWAKYSSNWYGQDAGINKQLYVWANNTPSIVFNTAGRFNANLIPQIETQELVKGGNGQPEQEFNPNLVSGAQIVRGQWFHIELILVGNTAGNADGSIDWYMDGTHIGHVAGVQFTSGAAVWKLMNLAPVWGGVGPPNVPATQTFDVDHFYMSGKN